MSTLKFLNIENIIHDTYSGELYSEYFSSETETFNNPLIVEIENIYNKIVSGSLNITKDQEFVLRNIFDKFRYVQEVIDPNRLKDFSFTITDEDDIVLYRNSQNYLINLVIHPEDDFTLSIINKLEGNSLEYFDNNNVDFEKIVYTFFK